MLGAALALGSPLALAPWPVAALVVVGVGWLLRAGRYALVVLALAALAGSTLRARHELASYEAERDRLLAHFQSPRGCHGEGLVTRSPSGRADGSWSIEVRPTALHCGDVDPDVRGVLALSVPVESLVFSPAAPAPVRRGDRVAFEGDLAVVTRFVLAELPDPRPRAAARGVQLSGKAVYLERVVASRTPGGIVDALRERVRIRVRRDFSPVSAPMAEALLLGDHVLDADAERDFASSGLSHLLAVSGMHLVLAVASVQRGLRAVLVRSRWAARHDVRRPIACLAAILAVLYADFAGGSGSAWRAAATMTCTLVAAAGDRRLDPARALGASVAILALCDPFVMHDLSFSLSVLATTGLLAFGAPITAALTRWRIPGPVAKLLGPTLAASTTCVPLLARIAPGVPTLALLLNLVAIPLSELFALPLCLAFAVLPELGSLLRGFARAAGGALELTLHVARFGAKLPTLATLPPTPLELVVLALGFPVACSALRAGGLRALARASVPTFCALLAAELAHRWEAHPRGHVRLTHLDIGQGDSALIDLPDGTAMLVDSGGIVGGIDVGERVLGPFLRARRRDRLRLVVVTHPHPDHFGGLATGAATLAVDEIWDTLAAEAGAPQAPHASPVTGMQEAWKAWRSERRASGTTVRGPAEICGEHVLGGAAVRVSMPCPELDDSLGANDNSIVFSLEHAGVRALFVGDAEHAEEAKLLALRPAEIRADLLKIGHHGSRTSTGPDFLSAVAPSLAVVSAGARNRFGHPHPNTLATLDAAAIPLARTDRMGGVRIEWNAGGIVVQGTDFSAVRENAPLWRP